MTPTLAQILTGNAVAIAGLAADPGGQEFAGARLTVIAMLSVLAAQEAERGAAARAAENVAIAAVLAEAAADHGCDPTAPEVGAPTLTALDAANAELRRRLIALHEAVEARGDGARDRAILALYRRMAEGRTLVLPAH